MTGRNPRHAQEDKMVRISFEVPSRFAPALRSAVEEASDALATRMEGRAEYAVEDAYVRAFSALSKLRAAISAAVPAGDPDYRRARK